jgi:hypothetical protein
VKLSVWDGFFWLIMVAIVFSLVRPGSKSASALVALTDALTAVIGNVTGYSYQPESG